MTESPTSAYDDECVRFTGYLIGMAPNAYVRGHYARACAARGLAGGDDTAFDRFTLRFAAQNRLFLRAADAYCALLARSGGLRRRLVLLAAILEHAAPTEAAFEPPVRRGAFGVLLRLAGHGLGFAAALILGLAVLAPARLAFGAERAA